MALTLKQTLELAVQQHQAGQLREAESSYRQVLGRFGVQSANDFKSRNPAVECAKFIWESLNAIEADQAKEKAGQPAAAEIPEEIWPEEPAQ